MVTGHPNAHSLQCDRGGVESPSPPSPVESSPPARLDESCPTCGEFQALREALEDLREQHMAEMRELRCGIQQRKNKTFIRGKSLTFQKIRSRLVLAEDRLSSVEECDCHRSCRADGGKIWEDGASWEDGCRVCSCVVGWI